MMCRVRPGARRAARAVLLSAFLAALLASPTGQSASAAPRTLPAQVSATYKISFTVLGDIGTFQFSSSIDGEAYTLAADATIDTAVFDYNGVMASTGTVPAAVTKPGDYKFRYKQKAVLGKKKKRVAQHRLRRNGRDGRLLRPAGSPVEQGHSRHRSAAAQRARPPERRDGAVARRMPRTRAIRRSPSTTASSASTSSSRRPVRPPARTPISFATSASFPSPATSRAREPTGSSAARSRSCCGPFQRLIYSFLIA